MKTTFFAALAATLSFASPASAANVEIVSGSGQRSLSISNYAPLGQSFRIVDTNLLSFGFQLQTLNPGAANSPLTLTLRSGSGVAGAVIATVTATAAGIPTTRTPTWFDFDLTGTLLTAGATYTALLTSTSARYGLIYGPNINLSTGAALGGDAYSDGTFVATGFTDATCGRGICDSNFRFSAVTPAAPVPEPATWALLIGGFGAMSAVQRRRRRAANGLASI